MYYSSMNTSTADKNGWQHATPSALQRTTSRKPKLARPVSRIVNRQLPPPRGTAPAAAEAGYLLCLPPRGVSVADRGRCLAKGRYCSWVWAATRHLREDLLGWLPQIRRSHRSEDLLGRDLPLLGGDRLNGGHSGNESLELPCTKYQKTGRSKF